MLKELQYYIYIYIHTKTHKKKAIKCKITPKTVNFTTVEK